MKWLVVKNPKIIPIEALEMLGGTDKNDASMIGKYGSGSKLAIVAALRNKIDIRFAIDGSVVTFDTKLVPLSRGYVNRISMQVGNNKPKDRDWTLDMGKEDWTDRKDHGLTVDWMILREFICNAIDEGTGWKITQENKISPEPGCTKVYIRLTERMEEILADIAEYLPRIAPNPRKPIAECKYGYVYRSSGVGKIYCKGVFVRTMPERMLFDYDFHNIRLTESRTIDQYELMWGLGHFIAECDPSFIAKVLEGVRNDRSCLEHRIPQDYLKLTEEKAQDAFVRAFGDTSFVVPDNVPSMMEDCLARVGGYRVNMPENWAGRLRSSGVRDFQDVIGADIVNGFEYLPENYIIDPNFRELAESAFRIVRSMFNASNPPDLRYFKWRGTADAALGHCNRKLGCIGLNIDLPCNLGSMIEVLIEEFAHWVSGAPDLSRALVTTLCRVIASHIVKESDRVKEVLQNNCQY